MHNRIIYNRFYSLIKKSTDLKIKDTLKKTFHLLYPLSILILVLVVVLPSNAANLPDPYISKNLPLSAKIVTDTIPITDRKGDFINEKNKNPFDIAPSILDQKV